MLVLMSRLKLELRGLMNPCRDRAQMMSPDGALRGRLFQATSNCCSRLLISLSFGHGIATNDNSTYKSLILIAYDLWSEDNWA